MHFAALFGQLEIVKCLVEDFNCDINIEGSIEDGPASEVASGEGYYDVVKYLLDKGAKLDVSTPEKNPLWAAICGNHLEIGRLLLEAGIDKDVRYSGKYMDNMSAIDFARERGASEFVKLLEEFDS